MIRLKPEAKVLAIELSKWADEHKMSLDDVRALVLAVHIAESANPEEGEWDEDSKLEDLIEAWNDDAQSARTDDMRDAEAFLTDTKGT